MTEPRIQLTCPKCGSAEICRDAAATWNPATQEWELACVQDTMTCQVCDWEGEEAKESPWTDPDEAPARDDEGRTAQDRYTDDAIEQFGSVSIEDRYGFYGNDGM